MTAAPSNRATASPTAFTGVPIIRRSLFVSILASLLAFQLLVLRGGVDDRNMPSELESTLLRVYVADFSMDLKNLVSGDDLFCFANFAISKITFFFFFTLSESHLFSRNKEMNVNEQNHPYGPATH